MDVYDVIIVGGGGSGAPLAARLSEDRECNVLLLEAGCDHTTTDSFPFEVRFSGAIGAALPGNPNNWPLMGQLTPDLSYPVPRGKIIGGSTSVNGTGFTRARKSDFDRWVAAGNCEWSYDAVLPYMIKLERDLEFGDQEHHGTGGPMPVNRDRHNPHPVTSAFYGACAELGYPEEADKNGEQAIGYGPVPRNAVDGLRYNTAICYLNPVRSRPNLVVRANTLVRKIVFKGTVATGVEVSDSRGTEVIEGREIVLCAGAIKTPQILLLSGVGPTTQLAEHGIPVVRDLPGVGEDMMDHPDVELTWRPKHKMASKRQRDSFQACLNFTSQDATCEGDIEILPTIKPIAAMLLAREDSVVRAALTFIGRVPAALKQLKGTPLKRLIADMAHRNDLFIVVALQQEDARGRVTLQSADPTHAPRVEFNYMSSERDRRRMREAVRTTASLLTSHAFSSIFDRLTDLAPAILNSDDKLDEWVTGHLAPTFHATSTCRMGADDDPRVVVDQRGRVRGVQGLRVGDVSICPTIPTRGPCNTAIMIGERMADFIKEDRAA